ncbi:NAD(P)H-dependent oxidoreductase [Pimelobacter simplex]|uniref:NAD(P)H-dependent oxidoreductase n=1 Tax=Nocardioides simplex TaxID=2045 RepID=UPI00214FF72B|nr:NAD(P)H-dependent oxidoreductase [Pimelobacter simplex]UUW91433.1 NAD(P)H-dependent oxidoreductase [Pimelobacter simplex]UUW95261.1 NAD(P)H-dependent oxidoreductase [Pimelobacter simplex]
MSETKVVAVSCSPSVGGKTRAALEAVLAGAAALGAQTTLVEMGEHDGVQPVLDALHGAEAVVLGSPMYRGTYTAQFKTLIDAVPRGAYGDPAAPLSGRAVLTVATAGSDHHLLGPGSMRDVLADFYGSQVVAPGLYVTGAAFVDGQLAGDAADRARLMGGALVELARAIDSSTALRALTPNV